MTSAKRLTKELADFSKDKQDWCTASLVNDNLFHWRCTIVGPPGSPYDKGVFTVDLMVPPNYPFKPPEVIFQTKTYHPNIQQKDGKICTQVLGSKWSPQIKIPEVLLIVRQMLSEPNIDSPLEEAVAKQFRENRSAFNKTAKEWTKKHAKK